MATISQYEFKHSSIRFRRKGIEIKSGYTHARALGGIARTRKLNVKKYFTKKYLTIGYTLYIFRIYKREVTTMKYQIMLTNKKLNVTCGFNKWNTIEEALNEANQSNTHLWKFHQDQAEYKHYWVKEIK